MASYRAFADVLGTHARDRHAELRRLGMVMTFTLVMGNTDAHMRNHALLHAGGSVNLAPVYDAAPTAEFVRTRQLALWIAGQPMLNAITREHLGNEMHSWGLDRGGADEVIDATLTGLGESIPLAAEAFPEVPAEFPDN